MTKLEIPATGEPVAELSGVLTFHVVTGALVLLLGGALTYAVLLLPH